MGYFQDAPPEESTLGSWGNILAMLSSDRPDRVLAADAAARRGQIEQWRQNNSPQARLEFETKQRQLKGIDEDQAFRVGRAAEQDRHNLAGEGQSAAQLAEVGRHNLADEGLGTSRIAEQGREHDQALGAQYAGLSQADKLNQRGIDATRSLHELDNANDLERARIAAAASGAKLAAPALPGFSVDNQDVYGKLGATPEGYHKVEAEVSTAKHALDLYNQLKTLRSQPYSDANAKAYANVVKMAIGDKSKEGSTGALSGTEYERYFIDLPAYTDAAEATSTWSGMHGLLHGKYKTQGNDALSAQQEALRQSARARLSTLGGHLDDDPFYAPKKPAVDLPQVDIQAGDQSASNSFVNPIDIGRGAMGSKGNLPEVPVADEALPVTGQRSREVPRVPLAAATNTMEFTPEQVDTYRQQAGTQQNVNKRGRPLYPGELDTLDDPLMQIAPSLRRVR